MQYLLDTHILLWFLDGSAKLRKHIAKLIINPENDIFISVASIWEIELKKSIHKLYIPDEYVDVIQEHYHILDIQTDHVLRMKTLPEIHKDPFDRILLAQANVEKLTFITQDKILFKYKTKMLKVTN